MVTDYSAEAERAKIERALATKDEERLVEARKLLSQRLETSWVASLGDFGDLSLCAQFTLFTRNLTGIDALAKMTSTMVADLDLSQVRHSNLVSGLNPI